MITLQIIYSHDNGQDVANVPIKLINMKSEKLATLDLELLFNGKYSFVADGWKEKLYNDKLETGGCHIPETLNKVPALVKISMCVTTNGEKWRSPKWYNECNGKIYFHAESN